MTAAPTAGILCMSTLYVLIGPGMCSAQTRPFSQPGKIKAQVSPAPNANAPWNCDLMIRRSSDGKTFGPEQVFTECGGVPSLTRSDKDVLVAAFQWFPLQQEEAFDKVAVRFSETGGASWTEPVPIVVNNLPSNFQRPFDPTIVFIPGGGYRMYFSCGPQLHRPQTRNDDIATWSAVSADGIHYEMEPQPRFEVKGSRVIDCAVAVADGTWYYAAPIGRPDEGAYFATSRDGITFSRLADVTSSQRHNWTGNFLVRGKSFSFYGSSPDGIWFSQLSGSQWSSPESTSVQGGDPAVVTAPSGETIMVYVSRPRRNVPRPVQPKMPRPEVMHGRK